MKPIHILLLDPWISEQALLSLTTKLLDLGVHLHRVVTPEEVLKEIAAKGFCVLFCPRHPGKRNLKEFLALVSRFRPRTRFVVYGEVSELDIIRTLESDFGVLKTLHHPYTHDEFVSVLALALGDPEFAMKIQESILASLDTLAHELEASGLLSEAVSRKLTDQVRVRTSRDRAREDAAKINSSLGRFFDDSLSAVGQPAPQAYTEMGPEDAEPEEEPDLAFDSLNVPATKDPKAPALQLIFNKDATLVRMVLYPLEHKFHEPAEILEEFDKRKINFGLDLEKIRGIVETVNSTVKPCLGEIVGRGRAAVDGQNGRIRFFVPTGIQKLLEEDESGKVDYKQMFEIPSVRSGELLAEVIDPTPAVDGMNVYGSPLRGKTGRAVKAAPGKGCRFDEENRRFYADADGQMQVKQGKISVVPVYVIQEDVDLSTGNVQFVGSVMIGGNVTAGFSVIAEGDIRVKGLVEAATLKAGGSITIQKGVVANDKGYIQAGADFYAKYLSGADVIVEGDVTVEDTIMNSRIEAGGKVKVFKHKGSIVGGSVHSGLGIDCLNLGSDMGVNTSVTVGEQWVMRRKLVEINEVIDKQLAQLKAFQATIATYSHLKPGDSRLDAKKLESLEQTKKAAAELTKKIEANQVERESMTEALNRKCIAKVNVKNVAYTNLKIVVGNSQLKTVKTHTFCSFNEDKTSAEVRLGAYDGKIQTAKVITTK